MPPTGGFGGNTGVQDGHNLAWKLAPCSTGVQAPACSRPTMRNAGPSPSSRSSRRTRGTCSGSRPSSARRICRPLVSEATVELGYRYRSSAVLSEADGDHALVEDPKTPSAQPGTRAPHLAMIHDGTPISSSTSWVATSSCSPGAPARAGARRGRGRGATGRRHRYVPGRRRRPRRRSGPLRAALRHRVDRSGAHPARRLRRLARDHDQCRPTSSVDDGPARFSPARPRSRRKRSRSPL